MGAARQVVHAGEAADRAGQGRAARRAPQALPHPTRRTPPSPPRPHRRSPRTSNPVGAGCFRHPPARNERGRARRCGPDPDVADLSPSVAVRRNLTVQADLGLLHLAMRVPRRGGPGLNGVVQAAWRPSSFRMPSGVADRSATLGDRSARFGVRPARAGLTPFVARAALLACTLRCPGCSTTSRPLGCWLLLAARWSRTSSSRALGSSAPSRGSGSRVTSRSPTGRFAGIGSFDGGTRIDGSGRWLSAGFIDAHMHVESSKLMVGELARLLVARGTTTIVCDPHELAVGWARRRPLVPRRLRRVADGRARARSRLRAGESVRVAAGAALARRSGRDPGPRPGSRAWPR